MNRIWIFVKKYEQYFNNIWIWTVFEQRLNIVWTKYEQIMNFVQSPHSPGAPLFHPVTGVSLVMCRSPWDLTANCKSARSLGNLLAVHLNVNIHLNDENGDAFSHIRPSLIESNDAWKNEVNKPLPLQRNVRPEAGCIHESRATYKETSGRMHLRNGYFVLRTSFEKNYQNKTCLCCVNSPRRKEMIACNLATIFS